MDALYARYAHDLAHPSEASLKRLGELVLRLKGTELRLLYDDDWRVTDRAGLEYGQADTPAGALVQAFEAIERREGHR